MAKREAKEQDVKEVPEVPVVPKASEAKSIHAPDLKPCDRVKFTEHGKAYEGRVAIFGNGKTGGRVVPGIVICLTNGETKWMPR